MGFFWAMWVDAAGEIIKKADFLGKNGKGGKRTENTSGENLLISKDKGWVGGGVIEMQNIYPCILVLTGLKLNMIRTSAL